MSSKRVLFLGGAYAQIPMILEAKKRNWYVITCDYLPNNPGHKLANEYYNISTTDIEKVLELAVSIQPDLIIAYASDPAAPVAAFISEKLGLPGNSYESIKILAEKDLFRSFLSSNGFNSPKATTILQNENAFDKIQPVKFPIIIKPTDSSGSKGVSKINSQAELPNAIEYAFSFSRNKRIIAEEFIETNGGQLHGDGFVLNGKLIFSHLGDHHYKKEINPFVPYATTWPSSKKKGIIHSIEKELNKAIALSGYKNGPVNIEVRISNENKIYIMEIGPRSGGNFVPQVTNYATGFDMVKAHLDVLEDKNISIENKLNNFAAYYVIHSKTDGTLIDLKVSQKLSQYIKEFHQYIDIGGDVKSFQGSNAAIGVLLLVFNSKEEMNWHIENMDDFLTLTVED